ncbi:MAG: tetratricopeptide repeat protein [Holophagales bacterium]|nr:tetratricopeptide repeat protein [Holophagales bacterium]
MSLNNLGLIVKRRGHLDEAEACYRESLEITRAADGEDSLEIPVTLMNLGGIYRDKGEFAKAEPLLEDALARDRKFFLSPNVALVRHDLTGPDEEQGSRSTRGGGAPEGGDRCPREDRRTARPPGVRGRAGRLRRGASQDRSRG